MSAILRRVLFSCAVIAWGGVILYFYASGRIASYLAPDFQLLALLGGIGLVLLGGFTALTADQGAACCHDHADAATHDHEETDLHPLIVLAVMLLPVGLSVAWTQDRYSKEAVARKGLYASQLPTESMAFLKDNVAPAFDREVIDRYYEKDEDGYYKFSLLDIYFSSGDRDMQGAMEGLKVRTEGRWVKEKVNNPNGTRMRLYRLFITCCAADSRAIPITVEFGTEPPSLPLDGWAAIYGEVHFIEENGVPTPVLMADRALAAEAPADENFMRN